MVTKDLQTLDLKFDEVMCNSLILMWERSFEVTFDIFAVLVFQINFLESYLDISICIKISYNKRCENCDNFRPSNQSFTNSLHSLKIYFTDLSHFRIHLIFTYCLLVENKLVMTKQYLSTHFKP